MFYCAQGRTVSQATINNGIDGQEISDRSRIQLSIYKTNIMQSLKTHTKRFHSVKFATQACTEKPKPKTKARDEAGNKYRLMTHSQMFALHWQNK